MRNFSFLLLFSIFLFPKLYSQNIQQANKQYEKAIKYLKKSDYNRAIFYLDRTIQEDSSYIDAYIDLGDIYYALDNYKKAIPSFERALKIDSTNNYLLLKLADSYFFSLKYSKSREYFTKVAVTTNNMDYLEFAQGKIRNCDFAIEAMKDSVDFNPKNIGNNINTSGSEYNPVLTADGKSLIYTVIRFKERKRDEDFFVSELVDGNWTRGNSLPGEINTTENEGAHCISMDGNFIYFTSCGRREGYGSCDIYLSVKKGDKWIKPLNLGPVINSSSWDAHPALSPDGRFLIFTSSRPGGYGAKDLYLSENINGSWSRPLNIQVLNTKGNEMTPFFHPDGETMYFVSDGLPGMGGSDFFMTKFDYKTKAFSEPINLGYKINGPGNEYSLSVSRNGQQAYFASDALDGSGDMDIYSFELDEKVRPKPTAYLSGGIFDSEFKMILKDADVTFYDLERMEKVNSVVIEQGIYKALMQTERDYAAIAKAPNHTLVSETFYFKSDSLNDFISKDFYLESVKKGRKINLNNILFESGKYELLEQSQFELDILIAFLKDFPDLKIKIIGHTDNVGTKENNLMLSKNRSISVSKYLISKEINSKRIKVEGAGESKPLNTNDTEEGRRKNRRTEIVLL